MVKIASICGTNEDINALLNKVYEIYERESEKEDAKQIYIYQDFIDNSLVLKELNELGIEIIYDLNNLDSEEKILIENLVEQYPFESIRDKMKYCKLKENRNDCYGYQTTFSLFTAMFMLASDMLTTDINFNIPALIALANVIRLHLKNQKITRQLNNQGTVRLTLNKKDII